MNILFLDDDKNRCKKFKSEFPSATIVNTAKDCIQMLSAQDNDFNAVGWDLVCLDHDLGGEIFVSSDRPDTGMEVVRTIEKIKPKIKEIIVHSLNYPAACSMVDVLKKSRYITLYVPFTILIQFLNEKASSI